MDDSIDYTISRRVCVWRLREAFNALDLKALTANGEVRMVIGYSYPVSRRDLPRGTRSQIVTYIGANGVIAKAHRYRARHGIIIGGREDPKFLIVGEEVLLPSHDDDEVCRDCPPGLRAGGV